MSVEKADFDTPETEPREIRWFNIDEQFFGRYILPFPWHNYAYRLKLHTHVFPDGNFTYLALPDDPEQLREFLNRIIEHEAPDLRHEP